MILSFYTQKSTRSAKLSSVFAERFSGEGQADFAINKAHKVSLKGRNNLFISCVFNGFKYRMADFTWAESVCKICLYIISLCYGLTQLLCFCLLYSRSLLSAGNHGFSKLIMETNKDMFTQANRQCSLAK